MVSSIADINLCPPEEVAAAAEKGLLLRNKFHKGSTQVGVARARDLKNRKNLAMKTVNRMVSYFARHEIDKKAADFGNDEHPSKGYIAWLLWGGDAGRSWAQDIKKQAVKTKKTTK